MEAGTISPAAASTGSRTIADLLPLAPEKHASAVAVRQKVNDEWTNTTFAQVGEIVSEIGRGLIDLGVESGERVAVLCNTRPEWSYASLAISSAGGVVVPVYPTNSPDECQWVVGNSESVAVVCEDASQVAKIVEVRAELPSLRTIVVIDADGDVADAVSLDDVRERGRSREAAELRARYEAVTGEDPFTFIYTSATTGPPKGCVLSHSNYRDVLNMCETIGVLEEDDVVYLFLPLAHAFALLIELLAFDLGSTIAFWSKDPQKIIPELMETEPVYFPSVPRIFEKLYTLASQNILQKISREEFD